MVNGFFLSIYCNLYLDLFYHWIPQQMFFRWFLGIRGQNRQTKYTERLKMKQDPAPLALYGNKWDAFPRVGLLTNGSRDYLQQYGLWTGQEVLYCCLGISADINLRSHPQGRAISLSLFGVQAIKQNTRLIIRYSFYGWLEIYNGFVVLCVCFAVVASYKFAHYHIISIELLIMTNPFLCRFNNSLNQK